MAPGSGSLSVARDLRLSLTAAGVLGAFSAVADWVWARFIPDGAVLPGVAHGLIVFVLLALVLGWAAGGGAALRRLLLALPISGIVIASAFYPLARATGYLSALLITWVAMWWTLAMLQRWARGSVEPAASALGRALLAAIASGAAFWAVSGMWTNPAAHSSYLLRLVYWTVAFLPGFLALFARQQPERG